MSDGQSAAEKPFSYATQRFTPVGAAGVVLFAIGTALPPIALIQAGGAFRAYENDGAILMALVGAAAWIASVPMMLIGRGLIYTTAAPDWTGLEKDGSPKIKPPGPASARPSPGSDR